MIWKISRGKENFYMSSDIYLQYHHASKHNDKLISLQTPKESKINDCSNKNNNKYIQIPSIEELEYEDKVDLFEVLKRRRSARIFNEKKIMSFKDFCIYIQYSVGKSYSYENFSFRTYPSGGAKYPIDIYIISRNVENIEDLRIYKFDINLNRLYDMDIKISEKNLKEFCSASKYKYKDYSNCNLYIFLAASFNKSISKYGLLGYRLILFEAGHIGQNLSLVAERMALGSVAIGGFYEDKINKMLGLNDFNETIIYIFLIGGKK